MNKKLKPNKNEWKISEQINEKKWNKWKIYERTMNKKSIKKNENKWVKKKWKKFGSKIIKKNNEK